MVIGEYTSSFYISHIKDPRRTNVSPKQLLFLLCICHPVSYVLIQVQQPEEGSIPPSTYHSGVVADPLKWICVGKLIKCVCFYRALHHMHVEIISNRMTEEFVTDCMVFLFNHQYSYIVLFC